MTDTTEAIAPAPARLQAITDAFQIGRTRNLTYLPDGLMNRNWRLHTDHGQYALKHITDIPADLARRNLRVLAQLADRGIPVCRPRATRSGDPVLDIDGDAYCLLPWVTGQHLPGPALDLDQAAELGATVGRIHQALNGPRPPAGLDLPRQPGRTRVAAVEDALATVSRYRKAAASADDTFDRDVVALLEHRERLVHAHAHQAPRSDQPLGPIGWTHGDLQHRNILWAGGHIAAVIDWDRIRQRPFAEEVVRTATIQFGSEQGTLDTARTSAFVAGYRSVIAIDDDALLDGLHRLWWKRLTDLWHLEFHYDRDDPSCDHLFAPNEQFLHWWTEHRTDVQQAILGREALTGAGTRRI